MQPHLVKVLLLLAAEGHVAADDLLGKLSAHDQLHDRPLLLVSHVLVHQILCTRPVPLNPGLHRLLRSARLPTVR